MDELKLDQDYCPFTKDLAVAWGLAHLVEFLRCNPAADASVKRRFFLDAVKDGLYLRGEFRDQDL